MTVLANTANGNHIDIEIAGVSLSSTGAGANAIDVTAANAADLGVTIRDSFVTGAPAEGIDVNHASTGTATLALHDNTLTATGTAVDIERATSAGAVTITAFHDNVVAGTSAAGGLAVRGTGGVVTFDASSTAGIQPVPGGATVIGSPGDRIGGIGLNVNNVTGALNFANAASGTIPATSTSSPTAEPPSTWTAAPGASTSTSPPTPACSWPTPGRRLRSSTPT